MILGRRTQMGRVSAGTRTGEISCSRTFRARASKNTTTVSQSKEYA
jgi:hypothetical protein